MLDTEGMTHYEQKVLALRGLLPREYALPPKKRRIAELLAAGLAPKQIAIEMKLSLGTVKTYLAANIYPSMGVHSAGELIRYWILNVEFRGGCPSCRNQAQGVTQ